jgi:hypothetical protein
MDMFAQQAGSGINWNAFVTSDTLPLVVFLTLAGLVALIAILARQWKQVRVAEAEAGLKLRMIERGFSADEIERVLQAGLATSRHSRRHRWTEAQACCPPDFVSGNATP